MTLLPLLAQVDAAPIGEPPSNWLPVLLLIVMGIGFAVTNVIASVIIGPRRAAGTAGRRSNMSVRLGSRLRTLVSLLALAVVALAAQAGQRWGH